MLAILALVFGGVAVILGIAAPGLAWLPAIAAIVIGIIALVKKTPPRWMAPVGMGLAVVGWIIGIVLVVAGIGNAVSSAIKSADPESSTSASAEPSASASDSDDGGKLAAVGETVTNNKKVAFTVNSIQCGIATAGPQYLEETAKGQFCEIKYTIQNGSADKITLYASDLTGKIGASTYDADTKITTFGDDYFSTDVNPGLSADVDAFIDIPAGAALDTVVYKPEFGIFTTPVQVKAS